MTSVAVRPIVFDSLFVTVARVTDLSPHLRRVTFVAPRIAESVTAGPDQRIKVLLPPPNGSALELLSGENWYADWCAQPEDERAIMRTYTIRELRAEQCELDIEFVLHGVNGPPPRGRRTSYRVLRSRCSSRSRSTPRARRDY